MKVFGYPQLRTILIVPFVLLICLAVGLTGWLSWRNGQIAINELATQLRAEITARIEERLQSFVEAPHILNRLNAVAMELKHVSLQDPDAIGEHFWRQIQAFPSVDLTYYGSGLTQETYGARRRADGSILVSVSNAETQYHWYDFNSDTEGQRTDVAITSQSRYDPRERGWYQRAARAKKAVWSEIYPDFSTNELMVTAALPLYAQYSGDLLGVFGVDVTLAQLSNFLRSLKVGRTGKTFIMERSGLLVASSAFVPPFSRANERLAATQLSDTLIAATGRYLADRYGHFDALMQTQGFEFMYNDMRHFGQITPWQDEYGLDWLLVVVIPEADFMQAINTNTEVTIILTVIALLITTFAGWFTARRITQPILNLNTAAKQIADGQWEQNLPTQRHDEIGELAQSFNRMGEQLRKSFHDLELANQALEQRVEQRSRELAKAYKRLKDSQAQLVQSEKMASLGQMVAGVAHEINTPLGYVRSNVEMAEELFSQTEELIQEYEQLTQLLTGTGEELDEDALHTQLGRVANLTEEFNVEDTFAEVHDLYKDTLYGIDQIADLVVNLKNFSRLEQAHIDDVNLHECIDSALMIGHNVIKHRAVIEKHYGNIPKLKCTPSQLNQVFLNLVTNAAQAIEHDHGKIIIKTDADEQNIYTTIQDNGKGIPKKLLKKIFDPFFTTKPVGEGTGLGLSISHQIIHQHGGTIKVGSQPGKGTKFLISLPQQVAAKA